MTKVGVIGTGYVGLVHGAVLSSFGFNVMCMDVNEEKIEMLKNGKSPIYEPGLDQLLDNGLRNGTLTFTTSAKEVIRFNEIIFIAVGTPAKEDGSADLTFVQEVVMDIGAYMNAYKLIVCKSTLPVGACRSIARYLDKELVGRGVNFTFDVASNPEFLRQGKAVSDSISPSRVVLGVENEKAKCKLQTIYKEQMEHKIPFLYTNLETAEMIKYASNAFLAVKISFINELALISEKVGANAQEIAVGMGLDERISPHFLQPGPGYGGSCFPKDTQAIVDIGKKNGEDLYMVRAAIAANEKQKQKMIAKISRELSLNGSLAGKTVAIWGLTFKPETDDIRYAPSLEIIQGLVERGALVKVFCPEGMTKTELQISNMKGRIIYCKNELDCVQDADAIVLMTEWERFRLVNWNQILNSMRGDLFFDLRNMFTRNENMQRLFRYHAVGSPTQFHALLEAL